MFIPVTEAGRENILIYSTYSILYANDIALYAMRQIKPFVTDRDKETQKIYGALRKRVMEWIRASNKLFGDDCWFLADVYGYLDDLADKQVNGLTRSIEWVYRCNGYEDSTYLARVETARLLCSMSVNVVDGIIDGLRHYNMPPMRLPTFRMTDIFRVMNNFSKHCLSIAEPKKDIQLLQKKSVIKYYNGVNRNILNPDNISNAYIYASKEFDGRNNAKG